MTFRPRLAHLSLLLALVGLCISLSSAPLATRPSEGTARSVASSTFGVYLPLVALPAAFAAQTAPIWAHDQAMIPWQQEVGLFRHTFTATQTTDETILRIFADSRYEAWLDGKWLGRGPARFSQKLHEYDHYALGSLEAGPHTLAILVQWSPNARRSESVTPFLRAHVQGRIAEDWFTLATSQPGWKVLTSPAWRSDAVQVSIDYMLIGQTELLDLRQLPPDWMDPGFDDSAWPPAVTRDTFVVADHPAAAFAIEYNQAEPVVPQYAARSIELTAALPLTPTLLEAGLLSPGWRIGEITAPTYTLQLTATSAVSLGIELYSGADEPLAGNLTLDGHDLLWQTVGGGRPPGIYTASIPLIPGKHTLHFAAVPAEGQTFALTTDQLQFASFPFEQGRHAGRRQLLANPLSHPEAITIWSADPLSLTLNTVPGYIVLDLGCTRYGRIQAEVSGPSGTILDVGWDERLWNELRPLPFPGPLYPHWNQVDSYILDGSARSISTIDARAGRYLWITAWGEGPVTLRNLRVVEELYPLEARGAFTSSDPLLDRIWQVGADTARVNMTDAYTDTPWRERGQWWGDAYVVDHANRVAFGDVALLRRGIRLMADAFVDGRPTATAPTTNGHMLDYGMLWVASLEEYTRITGDRQLLVETYPLLREFLAYLDGKRNPVSGLIELPKDNWANTVYLDIRAFHSRYGQAAAANAMYYGTLLKAAEIAARLSYVEDAALWRQKAEAVRQQANLLLYQPAEGRYLSNIYAGASYPPTIFAQAWPLAYGLPAASETGAVLQNMLAMISDDPARPGPQALETYGMNWALEALGRNGRFTEALDLVRLYYGYMLDHGATTWWERFDSPQDYAASLSHGWGSAPTWFLSTYILGAQWVGPHHWQLRPAFEGLSQVAGRLPLDVGELAVNWTRPSCTQAQLDVLSPAGTHGEVLLPFSAATLQVTLNGVAIWANGEPLIPGVSGDSEGVHVPLEAGTFHFEISQVCGGSR